MPEHYARSWACGASFFRQDQPGSEARGLHLSPSEPPALAIGEQARTPLGHPPALGLERPTKVVRVAQTMTRHLAMTASLASPYAASPPCLLETVTTSHDASLVATGAPASMRPPAPASGHDLLPAALAATALTAVLHKDLVHLLFSSTRVGGHYAPHSVRSSETMWMRSMVKSCEKLWRSRAPAMPMPWMD